jgi:hypothetical protein
MADGDRPDGLQDKFWDGDTNEVRVGEMSKAYNDLEVSYGKKTEDITKDLDTARFANRPESMDKYDFKLPDSIEVPPGFTMTMQDDHPLVGFWREHAFNTGLDQSQFEAGVASYMQGEIARLPVAEDEHKKLGENGSDRFIRVADFMKTVTTDDEFAQLGGLVTTAQGIGVVEKILDKMGTPIQKGDGSGVREPLNDHTNQPGFDNRTRELMGEKEYQSGSQTAIQFVRDRWNKAYPGQQNPEQNNPRQR